MFIQPAEIRSHLYNEVAAEIDRAENELLQEAINAAISEASGYLSAYDITTIFATEGSNRNAALLTFCKDIAVWHFIQLANPGVEMALRQDRYDRAIKWLEHVQAGKIVPPNLPYAPPPEDEQGNALPPNNFIKWGSNAKRNNNY